MKEIESNSRKITIPEALARFARVFYLSMSLLLKTTIKEHKMEVK